MPSPVIFSKNIIALEKTQPRLAAKLLEIPADNTVEFIQSKKGALVPGLIRDGRLFSLHSRVDPHAEGQRMARESTEGFVIAFGLGGAYHLIPLLSIETINLIAIIDRDLPLINAILQSIDMSDLFADSRVNLFVDNNPDELIQNILEIYLPVLHGNISSLILRSRWDSQQQWFKSTAKALQTLPKRVGRDYTVQAKFGRRWFFNTMNNLCTIGNTATKIKSVKKLLITAAGPSLTSQIHQIKQRQNDGHQILATDTSLSTLLKHGICPEMVISIDCQQISYHHFIQGIPKNTLLIADMASPPVLLRLANHLQFYASRHPLSLYIHQKYINLPILDISGGNVTHAAMEWASFLAAESVQLFGADFSFPYGRAYANGAYVYPYFQSQSTRTRPAESLFMEFVQGFNPWKEHFSGGWRWRTAVLDHYKESLEKVVSSMGFNFHATRGDGLALQSFVRTASNKQHRNIRQWPNAKTDCIEFLVRYRDVLESLPHNARSPQQYLEQLDPANKDVWTTILPAAAAFRQDTDSGIDALDCARQWMLQHIDRLLGTFTPR